ncbi:ParA family protein [Fuchsiella alkaliacetigena]|uniref:ParA family protein n=1 Tax=Fuchsiella alkaliacetigena TaxID=957042 RepID=UPI002009E346|nr:AAA family ATPase [Fuchsiella alkaliacetigena]MCK8823975.1 AAA family ATPase [Fuchsiella alkaliacetigena]
MNIISIVNQIGGVAKTTTAVNLASSLVELGQKVLVIDMDPQANLAKSLGFNKQPENTIYDILVNKLPLTKAIYPTKVDNLNIVPSNISLATAEVELIGELSRETLLKESLKESENLDYDYVIIDCHPSLGLLTINALVACNDVIIPVEPSIFAKKSLVEGLEQLMKVIELIRKRVNPDLNLKGALLTRVESKREEENLFKEELAETFGDKVFKTAIHKTVKIPEAQTEELPINLFDNTIRAAKEYLVLAKEIIEMDSK